MLRCILVHPSLMPNINICRALSWVHPDKEGYIGVFLKEITSFHKYDCDIPVDLDISEISPELILQLMLICLKKFVWTNFSKLKFRMIVLDNRLANTYGADKFVSIVKLNTAKCIISICAVEDIVFLKT